MPPSAPTHPTETLGPRLIAALIAAACLAVLAAAAWLSPDKHGHGTHTQLGMPTCSWVSLFDLPCPTCGMTTAFALAAEGDLPGAARVQPLGTVLVLVTAVVFWGGLHGAVTGVRLDRLAGLLTRDWWWKALLAGLIGSWVFKIATWTSSY